MKTVPEVPAWVDVSLFPFASRWMEVGDGRMHYLDEGAGRPVVFVHGAPAWSFLWRGAIRALRDRHRCIVPDLLGYGLSEQPHGFSYHPREQARCLAALLAHLDVRDATLVVHDWGGPIGLAWALEQPGRVRDVVLFNTWLWSVRGTLRGADWLASLWERRAALARKRALVVWGLADLAFTRADLERWRAALPHARVETFPRAGHFVPEEEPEAVARLLAAFLDGTVPPQGASPG